MPKQKPYASSASLPFMLQLRLSDAQYRGLALEAEARETSMAAVARLHIDAALRGAKMTSGPHKGKTLLQALEDDPSLTGLLGVEPTD